MTQKYTVVIEKGEENYIAEVVELPGCYSQAKTVDGLIERIKEAISLYLDVAETPVITTQFVKVAQVEV